MITQAEDLKPGIPWKETVWAHTPEESLVNH